MTLQRGDRAPATGTLGFENRIPRRDVLLFADGEIGPWGAAAIATGIATVVGAVARFVELRYRAKGGYAKDAAGAAVIEAGATVTLSAEERRARREREDAERKARREEEDAERETRREDEESERRRESVILREYKSLAAEQKAEIAANRQLVHDLRDDMQRLANELALCRAGRARADERIAALEEALDVAKIPHRVWNPDLSDGSGPHKPLPGGQS